MLDRTLQVQKLQLGNCVNALQKLTFGKEINPCPAEPEYTLPLQTVHIQISWLLFGSALFAIQYLNLYQQP